MVGHKIILDDRASSMLIADPTFSTLKDVQQKLDEIKAERRRRQKELYDVRPSRNVLPTSSSSSTVTCPQLHQNLPFQASFIDQSTFEDRSSTKDVVTRVEAVVPPYHPKASIPPQLLRMAYERRPDGRLSSSSDHQMGGLVEKLDVSPWIISAKQADFLRRENR